MDLKILTTRMIGLMSDKKLTIIGKNDLCHIVSPEKDGNRVQYDDFGDLVKMLRARFKHKANYDLYKNKATGKAQKVYEYSTIPSILKKTIEDINPTYVVEYGN